MGVAEWTSHPREKSSRPREAGVDAGRLEESWNI